MEYTFLQLISGQSESIENRLYHSVQEREMGVSQTHPDDLMDNVSLTGMNNVYIFLSMGKIQITKQTHSFEFEVTETHEQSHSYVLNENRCGS